MAMGDADHDHLIAAALTWDRSTSGPIAPRILSKEAHIAAFLLLCSIENGKNTYALCEKVALHERGRLVRTASDSYRDRVFLVILHMRHQPPDSVQYMTTQCY